MYLVDLFLGKQSARRFKSSVCFECLSDYLWGERLLAVRGCSGKLSQKHLCFCQQTAEEGITEATRYTSTTTTQYDEHCATPAALK